MQLPKANEAWYLIVFFTLTVGGLTLVLFNEIGERTDDSWVSTLANIGFGMGWVVIVAGAFAYTGMESFNMLAERYARRQREEGRQEGRQEGRHEVRQIVLDQLEKLSHLSYEERQAGIGRLIDETRRMMDGEGKGS
jgi:hypothetical protein